MNFLVKNYGGLEKQYAQYEKSSIVILPVPYDGTSTWLKGADKGPEAIISASENMELFDIETDSEVYQKGIHTLSPLMHNGSPEDLAMKVEQQVDKLLTDNKFAVTIGGEHSISIGIFKAFAKHFEELSILQLDAHADLRNEYENSQYSHACVMARAKEVAPVTQVGIRSMSIEEKESMDNSRIFYTHYIRSNPGWMQKVSSQLTKNVYITFDLDVLDPSIMPSTGTPEPDGLLYHETMELLRMVNKDHTIVGFDMVELCPGNNKAPDFLASKLIYQLLSLKFTKE
jgi:agmatinase